jgi:O-antigen/teichoic acid export membrane protein
VRDLDETAVDVRPLGDAPADGARDTVVRNGYLLSLTSVASAALGVAFWAVAARMSSPAEVGRSSATITALTVIANIAGLNLLGSFGYLVPRLGRDARRFVGRSYAITAAAATVLGLALLAGVALTGSRSLHYLVADTAIAVVFAVGAPLFVIFTIQDGVLIGLRRADWVLGENLVFALGKLAALVALLALGIRHGIAYSWIGGIALIVPVITVGLFRRLLHGTRPAAEAPPTTREVRRFVGWQYAGAVAGQLMMNLLPLLVLAQLGSAANGLFYVPWTIAITVDLISHSMGAALTAEGATDPSRLGAHVRSIGTKLAVVLGGGAVVGLAVTPLVLRIYGPEYASGGSLLLRLLIVGALLRAVVVVAQSAARARGRTAVNLLTETATAVLVLAGSAVLLPVWGISAVGWVWLGANAVVAVASLPSLLRAARGQDDGVLVPAGEL